MSAPRIVLLPGDGIGPEIMKEAKRVLSSLSQAYGVAFELEERLIGGAAIDRFGVPLPDETLSRLPGAAAVLLGAVGGPKWDGLEPAIRPEKGLLALRAALGAYANLRPARGFACLSPASPLAALRGGEPLDMVVVRELTGDIYFGEKLRGEDGQSALDIMRYSVMEIERVARRAFELARGRRGHVTSVDKANVLSTSRLWREVVSRVAAEYPDITLEHMYVDNAAMQLVRDPRRFDVLLTGNLFGDILSDEASVLTGSIGLLPSASLGDGGAGLYEPIHGSAPDIAGRNVANPLAMLLSVAMMLRLSLNMEAAADALERAVDAVLAQGLRTGDILSGDPSETLVGTDRMGEAVARAIEG